MTGACARNMKRDPAEIKPAQCCIKLVFHLTNNQLKTNSSLKLETTSLIQFVTTNSSAVAIAVGSDNNISPNVNNIINIKILKIND